MIARMVLPLLLLVALNGCGPTSSVPEPMVPVPERSGDQFDADDSGAISGCVRWEGPLPTVATFRSYQFVNQINPSDSVRSFANPNAPQIDCARQLGGAVVLLVGVSPQRGRPWDHPPASVELHDGALIVRQGQRQGRLAVVRTGGGLTFHNSGRHPHTIRGRGDDFFSLPLVPPVRERRWRLHRPGLVELSSGSGAFWMRAYALVSDHPYVAVTGTDGAFQLEQVPAGDYRLVVSHPSWQVVETDRNPDNLRIWEARFGAWIHREVPVRVRAGQRTTLSVSLGTAP